MRHCSWDALYERRIENTLKENQVINYVLITINLSCKCACACVHHRMDMYVRIQLECWASLYPSLTFTDTHTRQAAHEHLAILNHTVRAGTPDVRSTASNFTCL